ncbi:MAG: hypothetical protein QHH75_10970 [Bacillota bacterium]|jgi:hypothetical protein|nr:hypothetical protein [Bacillota bacterium]
MSATKIWVPVVRAVRYLTRENLVPGESLHQPFLMRTIAFEGTFGDPVVAIERLAASVKESRYFLAKDRLILQALLSLRLIVLTLREQYFYGEIFVPYWRAVGLREFSPPLECSSARKIDEVNLILNDVAYEGRVFDTTAGGRGFVESEIALRVIADVTVRLLQKEEVLFPGFTYSEEELVVGANQFKAP